MLSTENKSRTNLYKLLVLLIILTGLATAAVIYNNSNKDSQSNEANSSNSSSSELNESNSLVTSQNQSDKSNSTLSTNNSQSASTNISLLNVEFNGNLDNQKIGAAKLFCLNDVDIRSSDPQQNNNKDYKAKASNIPSGVYTFRYYTLPVGNVPEDFFTCKYQNKDNTIVPFFKQTIELKAGTSPKLVFTEGPKESSTTLEVQ